MLLANKYFKYCKVCHFDESYLILECEKEDKQVGTICFAYVIKLPLEFIMFSGKVKHVSMLGNCKLLNQFKKGFRFYFGEVNNQVHQYVEGWFENDFCVALKENQFFLESTLLDDVYIKDMSKVNVGDELNSGNKTYKVIEVINLR